MNITTLRAAFVIIIVALAAAVVGLKQQNARLASAAAQGSTP